MSGGCSESKPDPPTEKKAPATLRKRFRLENQGTKIEVSIPRSEGESDSGSYRAQVQDLSGSVQILEGERRGYLRDAWFVDVGNDETTQLVIWVEPKSGPTQLDWYEVLDGEWQSRTLPSLDGAWTYHIRRGQFYAEPIDDADSGGYTYSVPQNQWVPGLPNFED